MRHSGLLAAFIVALLAAGLFGYYQTRLGTTTSSTSTSSTSNVVSTGSVTGTSVGTASDTFFTDTCTFSSGGQFELMVASDSTGAPVQGESINAVDNEGCSSDEEVIYIDNFTVGKGGWLTPVWPNQAIPLGDLNFTVAYQGGIYNFATYVAGIGTACVTLHVPSGNVTSSLAMHYPCP